MRNMLLITVNTLKITFRKKGNFVLYLILPVIGIIASLGIYGSTGTGSVNIGVINNDNGILSADMIEYFNRIEKFQLKEMDNEDSERLLLDGSVSCLMVFPEGFTESFLTGSPKKTEILSIKGKETTIWIENAINMHAGNIYSLVEASEFKKDVFDRLYENYKKQNLKLRINKVDDQANSKMMTNQTLGFLILFVMLGTSMTSELILREKRNRTYFRICSSPVSSKVYISGNVAASILIVLVQIYLTLMLMRWVFRIDTYVPGWQMLMILVCFGLSAIGIGTMIVAFSKSSYQVSTFSTLVITPMCMLSGCYWSVEYMPDIMQKISWFMPPRWALDAVERLQRGTEFGNVMINLVVMLAFAAAFFAISAYKFSISDDVRTFV